MVKAVFKLCPRCGSEFSCHSGSIAECQCQDIRLNSGQLAYLAKRYDNCLCRPCLVELCAEYNQERSGSDD